MIIHGQCTLKIKDRDPATGKPYLTMTFNDGTEIAITTNVGEMIGGASKGARELWEEQQRKWGRG